MRGPRRRWPLRCGLRLVMLGKVVGAELRIGFLYPDFFIEEFCVIQGLYGGLTLGLIRHLNKPESF
jgi:hypothetical protein